MLSELSQTQKDKQWCSLSSAVPSSTSSDMTIQHGATTEARKMCGDHDRGGSRIQVIRSGKWNNEEWASNTAPRPQCGLLPAVAPCCIPPSGPGHHPACAGKLSARSNSSSPACSSWELGVHLQEAFVCLPCTCIAT